VYCGNCGRTIAIGQRFCINCGAPVVVGHGEYANPTNVTGNGPEKSSAGRQFPGSDNGWLRPISGAKPANSFSEDTPLAKAAYDVLWPYGLSSLAEARDAMPTEQFDYIIRQAQDLAAGAVRPLAKRASLATSATPTASLGVATTIMGLVLAAVFLWQGWQIYQAGQTISNASDLLNGLGVGQQATSFLGSLFSNADDYKTAGEAVIGAGLASVARAAFATSNPKVGIAGFGVASIIALSITGSGAGALTIFGCGSVVLTGLSVYSLRQHTA